MSAGLFITGTDTGCGKTYVAARLIERLRDRGMRVAGFKPVAAGAELSDGKLRNDDALALIDAGAIDLPYELVNPVCLAPPISPHLAAAEAGVEIDLSALLDRYRELAAGVDLVVAEGAGGWLAPLSDELSVAELALVLDLPVVLVVGLRLGCLNHARLTESAITASGARLVGWIGSLVDSGMDRIEDNLASLERFLRAPCLGVIGDEQRGAETFTRRTLRVDRLLAAARA